MVLASLKAAGKSRGETLYAVASAIANAGINWAYKSWNDWSWERREKVDLLSRVGHVIGNADLLWTFQNWAANSMARSEVLARLRRCMVAVHCVIMKKGLNAWLDFWESRTRNRQLLNAAIRAMQMGNLYVGFNTWFLNLYPDRWEEREAGAEEEQEGSSNSWKERGRNLLVFDDSFVKRARTDSEAWALDEDAPQTVVELSSGPVANNVPNISPGALKHLLKKSKSGKGSFSGSPPK